jgi:vacuolar-type H+-ATPase subunit E/Vma4
VSLDHLIATLAADAREQADRALHAARAEASALGAAADSRIATRREAVRATRETERAAAVERGLADTRHQAMAQVLTARAALLEQVFAAARARAGEMLGRPAYRDQVSGSVTGALTCLGGRAATVRCSPALLDLVRSAARNGTITVAADSGMGAGFRVTADDGTVDVDATLEARLVARAPVLSQGVLHDLELAQ